RGCAVRLRLRRARALRNDGARRRDRAAMRLVLCRHAEAGNVAQAEALARALANVPLAAVYSSPLDRALDTANVVAARHGLRPDVVDDLREIDLGDVAGLQFEAYSPELQDALLTAPGS